MGGENGKWRGGGEGEKVNRKMQMTFPTLLVHDLDIKVICTFALKINILGSLYGVFVTIKMYLPSK